MGSFGNLRVTATHVDSPQTDFRHAGLLYSDEKEPPVYIRTCPVFRLFEKKGNRCFLGRRREAVGRRGEEIRISSYELMIKNEK